MKKAKGENVRSPRGETAKKNRIGNPLDFIAEDHMREREVCALIDRLVDLVAISAEERATILDFLQEQLPHHLQDEQIDLFPMMLERCDPEEEIDKVIDRLTSDHGHAIADAPAVVALIKAQGRELTPEASTVLTEFARHARRHLVLENAIILPIARTRLTKEDLRIMKDHMQERRGLDATEEI
ncbi:hemerythrin domain-containing protein [Marimonas sp. MJW-29]|uniref:Hemerythrin domain-containing protein n=1 Tax=Sulfitobacter sediminis TaxID=3234186 RepID=A0ABV3RQS6_9RHOB